MQKPLKISTCFVHDYTFSLEHVRTTKSKPLITIFFFKTIDKTGNFAVLICCAEPLPANQHIAKRKLRPTLL